MELFHRRRHIARRVEGKILSAVLRVLKARTRGLGHKLRDIYFAFIYWMTKTKQGY
jgi:hypothetical protein